jgi:hypothetical protein
LILIGLDTPARALSLHERMEMRQIHFVGIGDQFGQWTIIGEAEPITIYSQSKRRDVYYKRFLCQCSCKRIFIVHKSNLVSGSSLRCFPCSRLISGRPVHGMTDTPTYTSWSHMIQHCMNPSDSSYIYYGGRGIRVFEPWTKFANFFADMGARPEGTELGRIDYDGDFCPGNCRWIPHELNSPGRRIHGISDSR